MKLLTFFGLIFSVLAFTDSPGRFPIYPDHKSSRVSNYSFFKTLLHFGDLKNTQIVPEILNNLPAFSLDQLYQIPYSPSRCLMDLGTMIDKFDTPSDFTRNFAAFSGRSLNELGDYYGCKDSNGRYIVINGAVIKIGLCLPVSCTGENLNSLIKGSRQSNQDSKPQPSKNEDGRDSAGNIGALILQFLTLTDPEAYNNKSLKTGTYVVAVVLISVICISILAAIIDGLISKEKWNSRSRKILQSFNVYANAKNMFCSENRVDKNLDILNGTKVLFMGWIMFGHFMMMNVSSSVIKNFLAALNIFTHQRRYAFYISGNLAVDVFFWLTGFLAILVCTEQLKNKKSIFAVLLIYLHRYIRMLPIYAVSILLPMYIIPYLYEGGNYYVVDGMDGNCKEDWIDNLLYINNFISKSNCLGWTWYIANDFQMYLLIPPLVLIYYWKEIAAYIAVGLLFIGSILAQIISFIKYDISADVANSADQGNHFGDKYYNKPYTRISPFLIGVAMAWVYIAYKKAKKKCKSPEEEEEELKKTFANRINYQLIHNNVLRYILYVLGFAIMATCVYTYFDFYKAEATKTKVEHYFFMMFSRPGFILGLACFIYPGCLGKASFLRYFLGYDAFNVLSKTIFSMYMFNMEVISFYLGTKEDSFHFGEYDMWIYAVDICILTFLVAIFATLFFEYPIIGLSKEFLRPKRVSVISGKGNEVKEK